MTAKDVIKHTLDANHFVMNNYLADLADADLLVRPVPGANHIAWQLGHLIFAEGQFFPPMFPGGKPVDLPAGFADQHSKATAASDATTGWKIKAEYLELYNKVRAATLERLAQTPEAGLEAPTTGAMAKFAPTVMALFLLTANHQMMHAGQFSVVRRKLGKPVLF